MKKEIFNSIDVNKDYCIKFNEFVAIQLDSRKMVEESMIEYMFTLMDKDNDKNLTEIELKAFFEHNNVNFNQQDFLDVFREIDSNGDKKISIEEFKKGIAKYFKNS